MSYSAVISVHPDVEAEFLDDAQLATMPLPLQEAIKGKKKGKIKKLTKGAVEWTSYVVWGNPEGIAAATERWGTNIEILGTWDKTGLRAGKIYHKVKTVGDTPLPVTVPAIDIEPAVREKLKWVKTPVQILDYDGNPVDTFKKEKVLVQYTLGEEKDIDGNVVKQGHKDIKINGAVVKTIKEEELNPDGTYTYQAEAPVTVTTMEVGTPIRELHAELLSLMPDDIQIDRATGNEISRTPATDLSAIPVIFGHKERQL